MSKAPPAFQFYPGDFLEGSAEMTLEETGLYIRLLCRQWITGSVPSDAARAATLAQTTVDTFERLWPVVGQKFESGTDGRLRNARLEAERRTATRMVSLLATLMATPLASPMAKTCLFTLLSSPFAFGLRPSAFGSRKVRQTAAYFPCSAASDGTC